MHKAKPAQVLKIAVVTVPVILGLGMLSGWLSNSGYGNDWFDALRKPAAMPPGATFGIAWTILYVLLGIALAMVLAAPKGEARTWALVLFAGQMALNYAWSPVFFGLHHPKTALAIILVMLALSVAAASVMVKFSRTSALLMVPYLGWLCFATYLNFMIVRLN